jgi:hypothetical protein
LAELEAVEQVDQILLELLAHPTQAAVAVEEAVLATQVLHTMAVQEVQV